MSAQPFLTEPSPDITPNNKAHEAFAADSHKPSSRSESEKSNGCINTPVEDQSQGGHSREFSSAKHTDLLKFAVLPDGRKQINQYVLLDTLGKGSFGKVKLAYDVDTNIYYAIKIIDKALMKRKRILGRNSVNDQLSNIRREIELMKVIDHKNVVQMYEIIDDKNKEKLYIVLEHMANGPVIDLHQENCSPLPEEVCKFYLRDILSGLEYLHSLRIVHRDIKPDNLLLSQDGIVKIADFGASMQFVDSNDFIRATAGSLAFMAPEMCLSEGVAYSAKKTDVWSVGITLYAMLFGKVPFTADTASELYDKISQAELEWPEPISPALEALLRGMLERDPIKRISLDELKKDPWLTDNGVQFFGAEINWRLAGKIYCLPYDENQNKQRKQPNLSSASSIMEIQKPATSSLSYNNDNINQRSRATSVWSPLGRIYTCLKALIRYFRQSKVQPEKEK